MQNTIKKRKHEPLSIGTGSGTAFLDRLGRPPSEMSDADWQISQEEACDLHLSDLNRVGGNYLEYRSKPRFVVKEHFYLPSEK